MRKRVHCLKMGSLKKLDAGHGYIAYARFDNVDCAVVLVNMRDEEIKLSVPVWEAGVNTGAKVKLEAATVPDFAGEEFKVSYGRMHVALPAKSACVFSSKLGGRHGAGQQISMF